MTRRLPDQLLARFSELVAAELGLHFPEERWADLEKGIRSIADELGVADAETSLKQMLSQPLTRTQIEILASALTVGETYFFRDKSSFEILSERVLPQLIAARQGNNRHLRIWSAGCCTGEEPYSIAIHLDRILPEPSQWHITILGTDINPRFLHKAADGVFSHWSFRDAPPWLNQMYFKPVGPNRFEILPRIKQMVTFGYLNLAEDFYPSLCNNTNAMDLIFCRNVIMYFSPKRAKSVIHNFHRSLVDSGCLFVSAVESSADLFSQFYPEHVAVYRKLERPQAAPASFFHERLQEKPGVGDETLLFEPAPVFLQEHVPEPEPEPPCLSIAEETPLGRSTPWEEALALFEDGRYVEAVDKLKTESPPSETAPEFFVLLARACANAGKLAEAREWAEKAISADKINPALHYLLATILQEQGDTGEAVASHKRALYLEPDFVLAHFSLGNHSLREGNVKQAEKHFRNAMGLLAAYQPDAVLPHSDGLAAGRLKALIESTMLAE